MSEPNKPVRTLQERVDDLRLLLFQICTVKVQCPPGKTLKLAILDPNGERGGWTFDAEPFRDDLTEVLNALDKGAEDA